MGAILPSSSHQFVLNKDSNTSGSSEDISPLSCPHLIWRAQIWNNNDVQILYDCMLDDGAHLVLIRPETVTDLGLPIHHLHEPVSVTLTLNSNPDSLAVFHDYVSLSLLSLNNAWTSKLKCAQRRHHLDDNKLLENVLPFNPITAITSRIKTLTCQKTLSKLKQDIKHKYKDVFHPIPHISELPTSETARIQLKNAYQTISKRQYDVPRQFHHIGTLHCSIRYGSRNNYSVVYGTGSRNSVNPRMSLCSARVRFRDSANVSPSSAGIPKRKPMHR